jgi:hypothetical protein
MRNGIDKNVLYFATHLRNVRNLSKFCKITFMAYFMAILATKIFFYFNRQLTQKCIIMNFYFRYNPLPYSDCACARKYNIWSIFDSNGPLHKKVIISISDFHVLLILAESIKNLSVICIELSGFTLYILKA